MSSTDKLFAIFWCLAATVLVVLISCVTTSSVTDTNRRADMVVQMVKGGADPMRVACVMDPSRGFCSILAAHN
jgi:hypothetical protein